MPLHAPCFSQSVRKIPGHAPPFPLLRSPWQGTAIFIPLLRTDLSTAVFVYGTRKEHRTRTLDPAEFAFWRLPLQTTQYIRPCRPVRICYRRKPKGWAERTSPWRRASSCLLCSQTSISPLSGANRPQLGVHLNLPFPNSGGMVLTSRPQGRDGSVSPLGSYSGMMEPRPQPTLHTWAAVARSKEISA